MSDTVRLNKFLGDMGVCSRREADRLIASGVVCVNGEKAVTGQKITSEDVVTVNGKRIGRAADTAGKQAERCCMHHERQGSRTEYSGSRGLSGAYISYRTA